MLYQSTALNHTYEAMVRPFDKLDVRYQVSARGGFDPLWPADTDRLFYRNRDTWFSVDTSKAPDFSAPKRLFRNPFLDAPGMTRFKGNSIGSPRCTELSNTWPSINEPWYWTLTVLVAAE